MNKYLAIHLLLFSLPSFGQTVYSFNVDEHFEKWAYGQRLKKTEAAGNSTYTISIQVIAGKLVDTMKINKNDINYTFVITEKQILKHREKSKSLLILSFDLIFSWLHLIPKCFYPDRGFVYTKSSVANKNGDLEANSNQPYECIFVTSQNTTRGVFEHNFSAKSCKEIGQLVPQQLSFEYQECHTTSAGPGSYGVVRKIKLSKIQ